MIIALFASCGTKEKSGTEETDVQTEDTEEIDENVDEENVATKQKVIGSEVSGAAIADTVTSVQRSVINYAVVEDPADFDPFANTQTKETLVGFYQPLAYVIKGEVVGCLMKDYTISDDGLIMDGELYDYITDTDGNNIKASDVVFSWEMGEEITHIGTTGFVDKFEATGDYTFRITFKQPLAIGQMDKLTKWNVVSEKAYSEHDMHTDPVPTGPYKLTKYTSGYLTTYEKRDDYWQTDTSKLVARDMANVDVINFYVIPESAQRTIALKNGSIDASVGITNEDLPFFDESEDFWLFGVPDDLSLDLIPNCDEGRLTSDVNLRRAIFYAISNEAILESVYGGNGSVNHDLAPNWAVGYNPDWDNETDNYYTYDPEKAKEYLAETSYNGEELIILVNNSPTLTNAAQLINALLEQVGIKTKISVTDPAIIKETYADKTAWDLYITMDATNTYWIDAINGFLTKDKTTWEGSGNFWMDPEAQEMINTYKQVANATPENFEIMRDYFIDNALCKSMVNPLTYVVVPSWTSGVCLSMKKCFTPGGSTYTEE
jgi:ABC-type transport system substrate-binding protein